MSLENSITRLPLPLDPEPARAALEALPGLDDRCARLIEGAAGSSPHLAALIERESGWLGAVLGGNPPFPADLVRQETQGFEDLPPEPLAAALRQVKRRIALWTGLADLGGIWTLEEVTAALSEFADRATDLALRAHVAQEIARGKLPPTDAEAGGILALAMGKLGARELNYSSDIDLIVLFDDSAHDPAALPEARAALIRATRRAVATLSDNRADGYVFRTDLRLRPDASVTQVCISISAALAYYEAEGRTWERAAYIKARPCAGDTAAGARFLAELRPFIWRRHLDFATIQETQDMRQRIRRHKGLHGRIQAAGHDMKLGQGGIREIEFFTQTRQLIAGGRDPELRAPRTVEGLEVLSGKGWVPGDVAQELIGHYRHHREVEHRVQMLRDMQTHEIPTAPLDIDRIARLSGEADTARWLAALESRLTRVEALTDDFFAPAETGTRPELSPEAEAVVEGWSRYPALRSRRARQIFGRIEGELFSNLLQAGDSLAALTHFDAFLARLPAGVQLFSLFEANPQLIELIGDICGTAPGLAAYLARHPEVLDAVLGGSFFTPWPGREDLAAGLAAQLEAADSAPGKGYEEALDTCRRWVHEWQFRTGVHHLRGLIDAEEAGRQYADIADTVLIVLYPRVVAEFARKHGPPPGRGAVVLGMGSLGARLLNARSDLDLIVIYDAAGQESSDGPRPLASRVYFSRLTQALITAVSAPTAAGRAYDVDMRLRPSGRQGPVATSFQAFETYQMEEAWTWERLALTRARVIAGCAANAWELGNEIEALRIAVLAAHSEDAAILPDLAEMRQRILASKGAQAAGDVKTGRGRLQDIELFAQSCALRAAAPARGTVAQLRAGQRAGLITPDGAEELAATFRLLWRVRATGHLLQEGALDPDRIGPGEQALLLRETGCADLSELRHRLERAMERAGGMIDAHIAAGGRAGDGRTGKA